MMIHQQYKFLLLSSLFCLLCLPSFAQIKFFKGSWEEALTAAKEEQKLIFMDAFTVWCGPCKMMDRNTFSNKEVGEFYNEHFINVKMDMEKGEGIALARKYRVRAYPSLLYIDYTGKLINKVEAYKDPNRFLQLGKKVIRPENNQSNLELKVKLGSQNPKVLYDYAISKYLNKEDYRQAASQYFATQSEKDLIKNTQNWRAIELLSWDMDSREYQYLLEKKSKFCKKYGEHQVNEKIFAVLKKATIASVLSNQKATFQQASNIAKANFKDKGKAASRLEMTFYEASKDWPQYASAAVQHFKTFPSTKVEELKLAAQYFQQNIDHPEHLKAAAQWMRQVIAIQNTYDHNMLYARLQLKAGNIEEALKAANRSLSIADMQGLGTSQYLEAQELVESIASNRK